MPQRKAEARFGQGVPAFLSMAKSAERVKAGATQQSAKQLAQSARRSDCRVIASTRLRLVERKMIVHMQTTLDLRISRPDGSFWEPFPWGEPETAFVNRHFEAADTWVMSRPIYEAVVPWWTAVARGESPDDAADLSAADLELAAMIASMRTIAISNTMRGDVLAGDVAAALAALKAESGRNIVLSCGPATLGPLVQTPDLIDEYLLAVHPAVLSAGPRLFDGVDANLALELIEAKAFDAGAVVLRYRPATAR